MKDTDYQQLIRTAVEFTRKKNDSYWKEFGLDQMSRFDWDQDRAEIRFFSQKRAKVIVADIQFIGTYSFRAGTWMWAWANPSLAEPIKEEVRDVRQFGELNSLDELTRESWSTTEAGAGDMASLACYILQSDGTYRAPDENRLSFLSLRNFRKQNGISS